MMLETEIMKYWCEEWYENLMDPDAGRAGILPWPVRST